MKKHTKWTLNVGKFLFGVVAVSLFAILASHSFAAGNPAVVTAGASQVGKTSADLGGSFPNYTTGEDIPSSATGFNYGTTSFYGSTVTLTSSGYNWEWASPSYQILVQGLTCGTTYHFQAFTEDGSTGADDTFTTASCSVPVPVVTTQYPGPLPDVLPEAVGDSSTQSPENGFSEVEAVGATVLNANGPISTEGFNFGLTTSYGLGGVSVDPLSNTTTATGVTSFNGLIYDLTCGTKYHYRAFATNTSGTGEGEDEVFTTPACTSVNIPPTVITGGASGLGEVSQITQTSANLMANLIEANAPYPISGPLTEGFSYGATSAYGSTTTITPGANLFSINVQGLTCGTKYHYRAFATNAYGMGTGTDEIFTTLTCGSQGSVPVVTTGGAQGTPGATSASVLGTVSVTNGTISAQGVDWGTTASYGSVTNPSNTSSPFGAVGAFIENIPGLACGTTYNYRAWATNDFGTGYGSNKTFATAPCSPGSSQASFSVTTGNATGVTGTQATLSGTATDTNGTVTSEGMDYASTSWAHGRYWTVAPGNVSENFSATATEGLSCSSDYVYWAWAVDTLGNTALGAQKNFMMAPCSTTPPGSFGTTTPAGTSTTPSASVPMVMTGASSSISPTSEFVVGVLATANGTVSSQGINYGTSTAYGSTVPMSFADTAHELFNGTVSGLTCGTAYDYRAYATNAYGTGYGANQTFTTAPCNPQSSVQIPGPSIPIVVTGGISSVSSTGAVLSGSASDTNGTFSVGGFDYGTTASYGSATSSNLGGNGAFNGTLSDLSCGVTYDYRAYATNQAGTGYGSNQVFTTAPCSVSTPLPSSAPVPVVATGSVLGSPNTTSADLSGTVTSSNGTISWQGFKVGTTIDYNSDVSIYSGSSSGGVFDATIPGLTCNTLYHYEAYAKNSSGAGYGNDMTFTTAACN